MMERNGLYCFRNQIQVLADLAPAVSAPTKRMIDGSFFHCLWIGIVVATFKMHEPIGFFSDFRDDTVWVELVVERNRAKSRSGFISQNQKNKSDTSTLFLNA